MLQKQEGKEYPLRDNAKIALHNFPSTKGIGCFSNSFLVLSLILCYDKNEMAMGSLREEKGWLYQYDSVLYAMGISIFIMDTSELANETYYKMDAADYTSWKWRYALVVDFCIAVGISFQKVAGSRYFNGTVIRYFDYQFAVKKYRKTKATL